MLHFLIVLCIIEKIGTEEGKLLYLIVGKFGVELNLAVWRIDQTTAKLKSADIFETYILDQTAKF